MKDVNDVCRVGQGPATCRYLTRANDWARAADWQCAKLDPETKYYIDRRFERGLMTATGDNCPGDPVIAGVFGAGQ